jgi:hypothetical protein
MQQVLVIHLGREDGQEKVTFLGQRVEILRRGCGGDPERARALIAEFDGRVAAIGLEGLPAELHLGQATRAHAVGASLPAIAQKTPVVDGDGVRAGLERWGVILADRAQPGIFAHKRVLMTPGLNHNGLAHALQRRGCTLHYADPLIYFNLPALPGVGSKRTLEQAAPATLEQLADAPFRRVQPQVGKAGKARSADPFQWADLLAGDIGAIRRYAPGRLAHKTVVVESATEEDLADLHRRGAAIAVTMMPSLQGEDGSGLGRGSAATIEALLVALRPNPSAPLSEDTYLDMLAEIQWTPAIRYLQAEESAINRFAFVIHPLDVGFIHRHPIFRWTRYLPNELVERLSAHMPPLFVSKITGGVSAATGQRIEGYLISLGATPRQMMKRDERFTYQKLNQAAHMAERLGARIMGLGAFTSVVGGRWHHLRPRSGHCHHQRQQPHRGRHVGSGQAGGDQNGRYGSDQGAGNGGRGDRLDCLGLRAAAGAGNPRCGAGFD